MPQPAPSSEVRGTIASRVADSVMAKKAEQRLAQAEKVADSTAVVSGERMRADSIARVRRFTSSNQLSAVIATSVPAEGKDANVAARWLQGCYELASLQLNAAPSPSPSPSPPAAAAPMRGQRSGAAAGVAAQAPMIANSFVLDSTENTRGGATPASKNVFASGTRSVIGSWVLLSPSSARVTFDDDGRAPILVTRAPNGALLARPANDTTLPASVLRRCP